MRSLGGASAAPSGGVLNVGTQGLPRETAVCRCACPLRRGSAFGRGVCLPCGVPIGWGVFLGRRRGQILPLCLGVFDAGGASLSPATYPGCGRWTAPWENFITSSFAVCPGASRRSPPMPLDLGGGCLGVCRWGNTLLTLVVGCWWGISVACLGFSCPFKYFQHGDALLEGVQELQDVLPLLLRQLGSLRDEDVRVAVAVGVPLDDGEDVSAPPGEREVLGALDTVGRRRYPFLSFLALLGWPCDGLFPLPCGLTLEFHHTRLSVESFLSSLVWAVAIWGQPVIVASEVGQQFLSLVLGTVVLPVGVLAVGALYG